MTDYVFSGVKWGSSATGTAGGTVSWSFATQSWGGYSFDAFITNPAYQALVEKAFATWEAAANIDFVEVADSASTNIRLGWDAIDGKLGQLGETHWTSTSGKPFNTLQSAEIRLDISESWSLSSDQVAGKSNFYQVVLHEIGHSLGLDHTDNPNTIMYPLSTTLQALGSGDVLGIQTLYGAHVGGATDGRDTFTATAGNDVLDGKAGIDTVLFGGARAAFTVSITSPTTATVTGQGTDTLTNIERLQFSDGTLALDVSGNAGEAYRIYNAAFHRTPDIAGLAFWIKTIDSGMSLQTAGANFVASAEFQSLYGANPTTAAFVDQLYQNVLGRPGEAAGLAFWEHAIDTGMSRGDVLANFSESAENIQGTSAQIKDGIWFT